AHAARDRGRHPGRAARRPLRPAGRVRVLTGRVPAAASPSPLARRRLLAAACSPPLARRRLLAAAFEILDAATPCKGYWRPRSRGYPQGLIRGWRRRYPLACEREPEQQRRHSGLVERLPTDRSRRVDDGAVRQGAAGRG